MGRRKRVRNHSPSKSKVEQDLELNEENWIPRSIIQQNKHKLYQGTQQS
jgi:hypothetical protein